MQHLVVVVVTEVAVDLQGEEEEDLELAVEREALEVLEGAQLPPREELALLRPRLIYPQLELTSRRLV